MSNNGVLDLQGQSDLRAPGRELMPERQVARFRTLSPDVWQQPAATDKREVVPDTTNIGRDSRTPPPNPRVVFDLALLGLVALGVAATTVGGGVPRALIVLIAMLVVPGGAVIARLGPREPLAAAALTVAISLGIDTAASMATVWAGIWDPIAIAVVIGVGSAGVIIDDLRRLRATVAPIVLDPLRRWQPQAPKRTSVTWQLGLAAPLVVGVAAWAVSLGPVRIASLGSYGLVPALGAAWYLGLALLALGAAAALSSRRTSPWLIAAFAVAIVVVLYATIPAISHEPQYTWLYKHIGVTQYIEAHGSVDPNLDIYNRWPGFFALAASFAKLAGVANPTAFAGWAEPMFALLDALLVAAIAHAFIRDRRVVGLTVILFSTINWVGQGYFSPQADGFTLALGVTLVIARGLLDDPLGGRRVVQHIEQILRCRPLRSEHRSAPGWSRAQSTAVILALDAVIVVTHELTPYVLFAQVAVLALLGVLRRRWIAAAMLALPLAFLLPNLGFIQAHAGLLGSLDPFANVASATTYRGSPVAGKLLNAHAGELLGALSWLAAVVSGVLLVRRGFGRRTLCLLALAFAPFGVVLVQNYGGEAGLRLVMFSAPATAMLIAWIIVEVRRPIVRGALTVAVLTVALGLFIPAFFGASELNLVPRDEVAASEYVYAHAPAGSTLLVVNANFPARNGARYSVFHGWSSDADPDLLDGNAFRSRPLGARDIPAVITLMRSFSRSTYLVFSATGNTQAVIYGLSPPGALQHLQRAVASSPLFKSVYVGPHVWIYRLAAQTFRPDPMSSTYALLDRELTQAALEWELQTRSQALLERELAVAVAKWESLSGLLTTPTWSAR
jgi:hypothetical protein